VGEAPPLVGVEVKVTVAPWHVGLPPLVIAMVTEGVTEGLTVMVILSEFAVGELIHVALDVMIQLTSSLVTSAEVV
jgi:hypothetical protein